MRFCAVISALAVFAAVAASAAPAKKQVSSASRRAAVAPVQTAKALDFVAHGVRMDYVHDYRDAGGMGFVYQPLEFFRRAEA